MKKGSCASLLCALVVVVVVIGEPLGTEAMSRGIHVGAAAVGGCAGRRELPGGGGHCGLVALHQVQNQLGSALQAVWELWKGRLSYLSLLAIVVVFGLQFLQNGSIPGVLPTYLCFD
ncbi:hypothetical protein RHMOL_Rhmol10G0088800 [Rhododendron molle]|uniref:Uncharacterized protein n=1 Tax=Rhododendron molle TaxID=49168 RepID=A0ACC0M1F8_RHOML|nr:hypothetical protein RHMOL_Rhmol10G0088800 [Rhododendron molle]